MAASVETPSPVQQNKEGADFMGASSSCSSSLFSPSEDKRFWSALRNRIDVLLEERSTNVSGGKSQRAKRLKEDSMLLLKGFDSVSQTLSQLSNNLENALQGAKDLAKPPTLTEILNASLKNSETKSEDSKQQPKEEEGEEDKNKKGQKRKHNESDVSSDEQGDEEEDSSNKVEKKPKENKTMKRAKNVAISMATKAASLVQELKSIKSDLCFMQERCALLEEENRRLRDGFVKGVRPEEDDLVRLQLEALLAEKSRLANENANLVRENQCLHQLVEYHQITTQDLSASYEQVIQGLRLDFEDDVDDDDDCDAQTPRRGMFKNPRSDL